MPSKLGRGLEAIGQTLTNTSSLILQADQLKQEAANKKQQSEILKQQVEASNLNAGLGMLDRITSLADKDKAFADKYAYLPKVKSTISRGFGGDQGLNDDQYDSLIGIAKTATGATNLGIVTKLARQLTDGTFNPEDQTPENLQFINSIKNKDFDTALSLVGALTDVKKAAALPPTAIQTSQEIVNDIDKLSSEFKTKDPTLSNEASFTKALLQRKITRNQYNQLRKNLSQATGIDPFSNVTDEKQTSVQNTKDTEIYNPDAFKEETELRKEFEANKNVKDFDEVNFSFNSLEKVASQRTRAADISILYNYMKIVDPGARVTEGDSANVKEIPNVPTRIVGLYNSVVTGKAALDDKTRKEIIDAARANYSTKLNSFEAFENRYKQIASKRGLNYENVIVNRPRVKIKSENKSGSVFDDLLPK